VHRVVKVTTEGGPFGRICTRFESERRWLS
jgi:hypothetical protein